MIEKIYKKERELQIALQQQQIEQNNLIKAKDQADMLRQTDARLLLTKLQVDENLSQINQHFLNNRGEIIHTTDERYIHHYRSSETFFIVTDIY